MADESWEALLPPLIEAAGYEATAGFQVEPLKGGVSSDIVRVRLASGADLCAKRALPKLKVASDWQAPLERNHFEVAYLRRAAEIVPGRVPAVVGEDQAHGIALLEYLPPENYLLWKSELLAGRVPHGVAAAVGDVLGQIHAATLNDAEAAEEFATDHLIDALRLDPYLRATAAKHPALADKILGVLETTWHTKLALVHGDVSPKNILISRQDGHPVLLDAECAWYGDPVFDGAFLVNHLLLKAIHMPNQRAELMRETTAFTDAWLGHFPVPCQRDIEQRTAALLPCLMLARVDGKSPVEYLSEDRRRRVRDIATPLIAHPPATVAAVIEATS